MPTALADISSSGTGEQKAFLGRHDVTYHLGFLMDQIAGHITNYQNLRAVAARDGEIQAQWHELEYDLEYEKPAGPRERLLRCIPYHVRSILRGTRQARQALRGTRPHALFSNASVGVFLTDQYRRVPTMIDFDCTPRQLDRMPAYGINRDSRVLARLKWRLSRRMYRSAARLQAWSRWAAASVVEEYGADPQRVIVNPPGIDLNFWKPGPRGDGPLRILFVGGDFGRKGGDLLLEWMQADAPAGVELHLVTHEPVAGGPRVFVYSDLERNTPQLRRLYHEADVFVLPSRAECFGIATVEAMGAGLPVIATDVGGAADIVENGQNGFLVPPDDPAALNAALNTVLADSPRRRALGCRARQLAEERFNLERNARRTLEMLKEMARPQ